MTRGRDARATHRPGVSTRVTDLDGPLPVGAKPGGRGGRGDRTLWVPRSRSQSPRRPAQKALPRSVRSWCFSSGLRTRAEGQMRDMPVAAGSTRGSQRPGWRLYSQLRWGRTLGMAVHLLCALFSEAGIPSPKVRDSDGPNSAPGRRLPAAALRVDPLHGSGSRWGCFPWTRSERTPSPGRSDVRSTMSGCTVRNPDSSRRLCGLRRKHPDVAAQPWCSPWLPSPSLRPPSGDRVPVATAGMVSLRRLWATHQD